MSDLLDRLALPEPVLARVGVTDTDPVLRGVTCLAEHALPNERLTLAEERTARAELRAADDGTFGLHGYASVTDVWYEVAGGAPYGWNEMIARGAFTKALTENDDVRLLIEHEGLPLARTWSRTLTLEADERGLLADAPSLDLRNPRAQELHSVIERGDADQMSFAFKVVRQEWNDDYTERRILEVRLYDVSVVTYPANPATVVALRNAAPAHVEERAAMTLATAQAFADAARLRARS